MNRKEIEKHKKIVTALYHENKAHIWEEAERKAKALTEEYNKYIANLDKELSGRTSCSKREL